MKWTDEEGETALTNSYWVGEVLASADSEFGFFNRGMVVGMALVLRILKQPLPSKPEGPDAKPVLTAIGIYNLFLSDKRRIEARSVDIPGLAEEAALLEETARVHAPEVHEMVLEEMKNRVHR